MTQPSCGQLWYNLDRIFSDKTLEAGKRALTGDSYEKNICFYCHGYLSIGVGNSGQYAGATTTTGNREHRFG
jgi:hypothetical protein